MPSDRPTARARRRFRLAPALRPIRGAAASTKAALAVSFALVRSFSSPRIETAITVAVANPTPQNIIDVAVFAPMDVIVGETDAATSPVFQALEQHLNADPDVLETVQDSALLGKSITQAILDAAISGDHRNLWFSLTSQIALAIPELAADIEAAQDPKTDTADRD